MVTVVEEVAMVPGHSHHTLRLCNQLSGDGAADSGDSRLPSGDMAAGS
jgi:hypothetical protein